MLNQLTISVVCVVQWFVGVTPAEDEIGWLFLYEGLHNLLLSDGWTAATYLRHAKSPIAGFYQWMANNETVLGIVDPLNVWGLIAVGTCLILGLSTDSGKFPGENHIRHLARAGIGTNRIEQIEVCGLSVAEALTPFNDVSVSATSQREFGDFRRDA
jgi:hypothetical protein